MERKSNYYSDIILNIFSFTRFLIRKYNFKKVIDNRTHRAVSL